MMVSEVGRMAMGAGRSLEPLLVTQATYGLEGERETYFGGKTLDMLLFSFKSSLGDEEREVGVLRMERRGGDVP